MATVLLVEDEDSLRETLCRFLVHEGHDVIAASSGYEALEAGFDAAPDILIADWMLKNHIHGLHVSEVFRGLHPGVNTILITGFPSRDLLDESDRCGVSRLLEKPFDLEVLQEAVDEALTTATEIEKAARPIAAMAISSEGAIQYVSPQARALLHDAGLPAESANAVELMGDEALSVLRRAEREWVEVTPPGAPGSAWVVRTRRRPGGVGWLAVVCARDEEQRRNDPRVRILLDVRGGTSTATLEDRGPILVIERDGVVRRLLVSQIERLGAICYPSDDLENALRLLAAETRARTVLVDFALAGDDMAEWVDRIRAVQPEAVIIGTGGIGAESDLLAQGAESVLRKPWRINDLVAAIRGGRRSN